MQESATIFALAVKNVRIDRMTRSTRPVKPRD